MPRIVRYEDNRAASFLRRGMYAEALACAVEVENRLLPPGGSTVISDIGLLVRIILAKCAAQIHLKQYRDSRFSAMRANQIVGLYGHRTPEIEHTYGMLSICLKDLEDAATTGTAVESWINEQPENERDHYRLINAMEIQRRLEATFTELATALMRQMCELIL